LINSRDKNIRKICGRKPSKIIITGMIPFVNIDRTKVRKLVGSICAGRTNSNIALNWFERKVPTVPKIIQNKKMDKEINNNRLAHFEFILKLYALV